MHLEDGAGVRAEGTAVVGERDAVRRPDLAEPGTGGGEQVGDAEAVADLDELAAGQDELPTLCQGGGDEREGGGAVVDDDRRLGGRDGGQQRGDRALPARPAATGGQVELDVGGAAGRDHRLDGDRRQGRAAQVGVHQHAGGVEHRLQAARCRGERGEDGVDGVGRGDLAGPDPLLDPLDGVLDQGATQPGTRLGQPVVGQQGVGARHLPPRVRVSGALAHRDGA